MLENNSLKERIKRGEIELHARSIYLQGIILQKAGKLPGFMSREMKLHQESLNAYAEKNSVTTMDIANKFIQDNKLISKAVIGVANSKQLEEIIKSWDKIKDMELENDWNWKVKTDIDPRYWGRNK